MALPLFDHQSKSIAFIRANERVFDASDPGTGKTRVAVESFAERRLRGGGCALVLAPKSLVRSAWENEFKKFAPHLVVTPCFAERREESFAREADIYVTNHDAATWLAKQKKDFFSRFDTLIVDEVGAYKHATSQRSKALNRIKVYFKHRLVLNGTPTPNSVTDIWNQMFILDDGQRLGASFYAFRQAVCIPKQVGPSASMIKWTDKPGASDAVTKLIEDVTIRHKFEDCIDIPDNHEYCVPYTLTSAQQRAYDQMEMAQITLLGPASSQRTVSAVNAAAVATKLLQIASGAVYEDQDTYHLVDTARYELVLDMAEQRPHTVVFFLWKHQKDFLLQEAKKRGLSYCLIDGSVSDKDKHQAVDYFQKGFYRICFAHPQSAAHGLTLTRGTATIWASPTYNLEHYQQGLKRIYRAGQTAKTETISIIARNTIEDRVWSALQNKKVQMDDLLGQLTV